MHRYELEGVILTLVNCSYCTQGLRAGGIIHVTLFTRLIALKLHLHFTYFSFLFFLLLIGGFVWGFFNSQLWKPQNF